MRPNQCQDGKLKDSTAGDTLHLRNLDLLQPMSVYTLSSHYKLPPDSCKNQQKRHTSDRSLLFENTEYFPVLTSLTIHETKAQRKHKDITQPRGKKIQIFCQNVKIRINRCVRNGTTIVKSVCNNRRRKYLIRSIPDGQDAGKLRAKYKKKVLSLLYTFAGETTAHGYKRWISQTRTPFLKFLWAVIIVCVLCILMLCLHKIIADNQLNSFSTSFKYIVKKELTFPAVTICNVDPFNISDSQSLALVEEYDEHLRSLQNDRIPWTSRIGYQQWVKETYFVECLWNGMKINCSKIFSRTTSHADSCFTLNANVESFKAVQTIGVSNGLTLTLNLGNISSYQRRAGIKVFLNDATEFPNTFNNVLLVAPNTTAYIGIRMKQSKYLEYPFQAYGDKSCFDYKRTNSNNLKLQFYNSSGYSWCVADCILSKVVSVCQCLTEEDPVASGIPYCSQKQYFDCYLPEKEKSYSQLYGVNSICSCSLPCFKTEYLSTMSTTSIIDTSGFGLFYAGESCIELNIYFETPLVLLEEQIAKYLWADIFGSVGGQIGLFTGASLLTLAEFGELLYLLFLLLVSFVYKHIKLKFSWQSSVNTVSYKQSKP